MRKVIAVLVLFVCVSAAEGRMVAVSVHSPSLEKNLLGDPADLRVEIYFPPSYESDAQRRYPVLYLLHGFLGDTSDFTQPSFQGFTIEEAMNDLAKRGVEFIVVVPSGRNRYAGSYYANSALTGNWEDAIVTDLVAFIDSHYRTLAQPSSRGVAGHSMGGYAALMMAMKHAGTFRSAYAMSPCCLGWEEDFGPANPAWKTIDANTPIDDLFARSRRGDYEPLAIVSAAAAFSPNPNGGALKVDLPFSVRDGNIVRNEAVAARWESMQPLRLVDRYADSLQSMRGLAFDAGFADQFHHIPITTRKLSSLLAERGIAHAYEAYNGDHRSALGDRMRTRVLPFFARNLAFVIDAVAASAPANIPNSEMPAKIDPAKNYLFYFQPGFVDRSGPVVATKAYGTYDMWEIIRGLQSRGFTVIAGLHEKDNYARTEATRIAPKVKQLLAAGVPSDHITLSGYSKGGVIALMAAEEVADARVNVVAMGICSTKFRPDEVAEIAKIHFAGRIMVMHDSAEETNDVCKALPSSLTRRELTSGLGIGTYFSPRREWIDPLVEWATQKR
jgi:S-formylglutathione hydrolase FrmB